MPKTRMIKPEFFVDDDLARCTRDARLAFIGLWLLADRSGRLEDKPAKIRAQIFPYDRDVSTDRIEEYLAQLADGRFIIRYHVGDKTVIQIRTFTKHQHCHDREKPSELPAPPERAGGNGGDWSNAFKWPEPNDEPFPLELSDPMAGEPPGEEPAAVRRHCVPRRRLLAPADFLISEKMRRWAGSAVPHVDLDTETASFLDHHAAKGSRFVDWEKAWRVWMRNAEKWSPQNKSNVRSFEDEHRRRLDDTRKRIQEQYGRSGGSIHHEPVSCVSKEG